MQLKQVTEFAFQTVPSRSGASPSCLRELIRGFKKTTTVTSRGTLQNNGVNEQNYETARAKYNLLGFSALLCKITTWNEHFPSFTENAVVQR